MTLKVGREFGNAESSASVLWATFCPEPASEAVCWRNAWGPVLINKTTGHIIAAEMAIAGNGVEAVRKQTCVEQL
jgi:hypothetical protein